MAFANRPVRIFAVIRVNEQPIRRELKTFHQHRAFKRKDINAVTFKVVFRDIDKNVVTGLNGAGHAISGYGDHLDMLCGPVTKKPQRAGRVIGDTADRFINLTGDNAARPCAGLGIQNLNDIWHLRRILYRFSLDINITGDTVHPSTGQIERRFNKFDHLVSYPFLLLFAFGVEHP